MNKKLNSPDDCVTRYERADAIQLEQLSESSRWKITIQSDGISRVFYHNAEPLLMKPLVEDIRKFIVQFRKFKLALILEDVLIGPEFKR